MAAVARVLRGSRFLMSPAATAAGGKVAKAAGASTGAAKSTKAAAAAGAGKKEGGGIMKPVPVSDAFRSFAGVSEVSRAGAVKLIWDHIKANGLQNPANKREINCDAKLKILFGARDKIGMMEIAKLLKPHFVKTN
ncbi:hypothetical protein ACP70R_028984 [Stipagrostis hirtigluma subsp. patula]